MKTEKRTTRADALRIAQTIGCEGAHEHDGEWMPCSSHDVLMDVSNSAEDDSWLKTIDEKATTSLSGRKRGKRKNRTRHWENLKERTYGIESVPNVGLVSGDASTAFSGSAGKAVRPFSPEVGDPDVYTSPDAARMRSVQVGCTGIRRYTTRSGRNVWMACTTGVTHDKLTDQGAYQGRRARLEDQRVQRIVKREIERANSFGRSKKDARSRKISATPAKRSERISGSSTNSQGSSSSISSASSIVLSQQQIRTLATKAREHNARMKEDNRPPSTMTSTNALKAVMRRGMGAFSGSHRPDVSSRQQWGMGRVNAFLRILDKGKPKNPKYVTDNDLLRDGHPWKNTTGNKVLPNIGRTNLGIPMDGDGDELVYDGTIREMPAPTRGIGKPSALMPLGAGNVSNGGQEINPKVVAARYLEIKKEVEDRFGEIKTQKQAAKALRKVFRKAVELDLDFDSTKEDLDPSSKGVVVALLHAGMLNKKYANAVISLTAKGTMKNGRGTNGGYLGIAGLFVRQGRLGASIDFSPKIRKGAVKNVNPNPTGGDGWMDSVVREAWKSVTSPEDFADIDEMYGAYIASHEWGHVLHFAKSIEYIGFTMGMDAVDLVGKHNGLSRQEISDEINRLEADFVAFGLGIVEARHQSRQKFVTDNYQAIDDLWRDRPFDGLSDEEVDLIEKDDFLISPYAGRDSFEMVAETVSAEKLGHPVPDKETWAKMSAWLSSKSARKAVVDILENGDMFVPVCDGLGNRTRTLATKKDPMDADSDGWIDEGKPTRRFVGVQAVVNAVSSANRRRKEKKPVRVSITESGKGNQRGRAKRAVKEMEEVISKLRKGEKNKPSKGFKPTGKKVPDRLSPNRIASLTPSRKSHAKLVQSARDYEVAPALEGEHNAAKLADMVRPDGSLNSTFDHHGIGSGAITTERKKLHDAIIQSIVFGNGKWKPSSSTEPTAWMMGGGPASGKTFLRQGGYFDTPKRGETVHLDADEIKQMIPEFESLRAEMALQGMDPLAASAAVHAESTYIQREAMRVATQGGFNVVVDSTGDGGLKSFNGRIDILKQSGYKIKGRVADVSIAKALTDAKKRQATEGRGVAENIVVDTHIDVAQAVLYALQEGLYEDFELVDNENHKNPKTVAAMKDGELVIYDKKAWSQFIAKATIRSTEQYDSESEYFAGTPEAAIEMARKRVKARKVRTKRIEGVDSIIAEPVPFLADLLPETSIKYDKVEAIPEAKRKEMTKLYEAMPEFSEEARESYEALTTEIAEQYEMLKNMGIRIEFVDDDPYGGPLEMMDDIQINKRLKVLKTEATGPHPYWTNEENDKFRAVHDAFGHAATGRGFDRHGEEAAYQAHSTMMSDLARRALLTETRGQNVVVITTGEFPPQKMGLLPEIYVKDAGSAGIPQMPRLQAAVPDLSPPTVDGDFPVSADEDNLYNIGRCHHTTGGRRLEPNPVVVSTDAIYDDLVDDQFLRPETRTKIYEAVSLGRTLEDSDVDETNPEIAAYYAKTKKAVKKLGKSIVADIPNSAVDVLPEK